jgi:hypothetical protein
MVDGPQSDDTGDLVVEIGTITILRSSPDTTAAECSFSVTRAEKTTIGR